MENRQDIMSNKASKSIKRLVKKVTSTTMKPNNFAYGGTQHIVIGGLGHVKMLQKMLALPISIWTHLALMMALVAIGENQALITLFYQALSWIEPHYEKR